MFPSRIISLDLSSLKCSIKLTFMSYTDHESNSICNPWSSCLATRHETGNKHVQLITVQKPMYVSRSSEGYLTTGCWSPTRPAVIYIGLIDGTIEVWDLLDQSHQPSMTALVSSCQLTSMEFWKLSSKPLQPLS